MNKIKDFLKDHWRLTIISVVLVVLLIFFDLGGFRSDYEAEPSTYIFTLLFLMVVAEGIFLLEKLRYIRGLEDTVRYLNAKFGLYRKIAHPDSKFSISQLKPVGEDEAAPWTVEDGIAVYYGQSNYEKAVLNSRERLQKKLKAK